jgi:hypothetical protein
MADRILVLMQWNEQTERVSIAVGGQSVEFDPRISLYLRGFFRFGRDLTSPQYAALRHAANAVITPIDEDD